MITPTQQRIYQFIKQFIKEQGYSPSLVEIANGIGVRSKSLISRYVHVLKKAGLLDLEPGCYRQVRLKPDRQTIPLMGRVAAGVPIEAIAQQTLDLNDLFAKQLHTPLFALQVKGDSMIEEGIFDGDLIFCEAKENATEGDIVVALIDEHEATLKRIHFQNDGKIVLIPANAALRSLVYDSHRVRIQGIFAGLIRLNNKHSL